MTRKKLVAAIIGTIALGPALILIEPSSPSSDSTLFALPPPPCVGSYQTPLDAGHGASCSESTRDLFDRSFARAQQTCGVNNVCDASLIITVNCHDASPCIGGKEVNGYLQHGCFSNGGPIV